MKFISFAAFAAAALLAACNPGTSTYRIVKVDHLVVEGPTVDADACYLRLRPMADEKAAPVLHRYLKPEMAPSTNVYKIAYDKCRQSKPGDRVTISDRVLVPTKAG